MIHLSKIGGPLYETGGCAGNYALGGELKNDARFVDPLPYWITGLVFVTFSIALFVAWRKSASKKRAMASR